MIYVNNVVREPFTDADNNVLVEDYPCGTAQRSEPIMDDTTTHD